jgi:uncharacterized damage-inducible protein DinB
VPEITALLPKGFLERQGVTFVTVQSSLERARTLLDAKLARVPDGVFHSPIAPGKWSPAEIADHVIKANHLFAHALEIGLRRTANASLEILKMPRGRVTDDGRAIAPTDEEPTPGRPRDALKADLDMSFAHLVRAALDLDAVHGLGTVCVDQSFFGPMNGQECLQLMAWHTAHHAKQLPILADLGA